MRLLLPIFVLTFFTSGNIFAQTQADMNKEASEVYKQVNDELNSVYQQIEKEYSDDTTFLSALKTSQRNWIVFRDSEVKMKYPDREPGWYGSVHPMCFSYYMAQLTTQRIEVLNQWIVGVEEGDVCAGSITKYCDEVEPELLEKFVDFDFVRLLNTLSFWNNYRTDELSIQVFSSPNLPGSAGFNNGEVTSNIWIAVSEYDELPEQTIYRLNNLYAPELLNFDGTNPKEPKLTLQHIEEGTKKKITLQFSIEKIVQI
jgi:uncharacterized protein YecT (DUF1311 family)